MTVPVDRFCVGTA